MHDSSCSQFFSIEDAATCKLTRIICFLNFQLVWMENLADRLRRVFCMILDFFNFIPAKDPTDSLHQIGLHDVSFFLRVHLNRRAVQTHCVQVFSWCFTLTASLFQQKIWQTHFKNQPYIFGCQIISMKKHCIKRLCIFLQDQNWQQQSRNQIMFPTFFDFEICNFSFLNTYAPKNTFLETKWGVSGPYQGRIRAVSEPYQSRIRPYQAQIFHFSQNWNIFSRVDVIWRDVGRFLCSICCAQFFPFKTKCHQANPKHICWQSCK